MDLGVAQTLAATGGANDLSGLKKTAVENNPSAMRKVAQQFGSLLMQNLMREPDGTALPMVGGTGGEVVNQMFTGTISQAVMSHDKMGLTDLILRSLQKKQAQASGDAPPGRRFDPFQRGPECGQRPAARPVLGGQRHASIGGGHRPGRGHARHGNGAGADDALQPEARCGVRAGGRRAGQYGQHHYSCRALLTPPAAPRPMISPRSRKS